jgi:DNA-binding transcriptional LysR family regulator
MQSQFKDWGDARIFLAVFREGSTLAAARILGINQTTVARRIGALEHSLGLPLFNKTTRGATPTAVATRLLPFVETLEGAAMALESEAMTEQGRSNPPIRITAFDNAGVGNIGQVVADFVDRNPSSTFEFIVSERILDLINGDADVALRISPVINDDRLFARKVGQTQWTYYASRSYAEKNGTPDAFTQDMGPHRVVLLSHITTRRHNVLRCASADDLRIAISTGQGIGPIPIYDGDKDPTLVRCFDPPEGSEMSVWLITSPEAHKRADVRRFTAFAAPLISRNLREVSK